VVLSQLAPPPIVFGLGERNQARTLDGSKATGLRVLSQSVSVISSKKDRFRTRLLSERKLVCPLMWAKPIYDMLYQRSEVRR